MTTLKLILGDQLNSQHSWFDKPQTDTVFLIMEIRQETDYVLHHAQKILAIFAGMRELARHLAERGHRVRYFAIDDHDNRQSLTENIDTVIRELDATTFKYQEPDEWRLDQQLATYCSEQSIPCSMASSEHFYTLRHDAATFFGKKPKWLMEHFYRDIRVRHQVLMEGKKPAGGQWNYDHENRKSWSGNPTEPRDFRESHDHSALWKIIVKAEIKNFGEAHADRLPWPLNREEALNQLHAFVKHALPHFGEFQDAMHTKATRLFHSLLSFALNTKMIGPREVVEEVEKAWQAGLAPIEAAEGFIRQILGWREYIRGVYWARMPGYTDHNVFDHHTPLPAWFWTGDTKMRCLSESIGNSLENAHAHHIQRLMIIGNFALLAGLDPIELHHWYLGIYIDAFEWVELPNTLGMSQFADGGLLATKPYVSSAAYINRMSDYCKGCNYNYKLRDGENACPFNALYWDFFMRNGDVLKNNPRIGMVYRQLEKMEPSALNVIQTKALNTRERLNDL